MTTTTLNRIRAHYPCAAGWEMLLAYLGKTKGDDDPLPFSVIVKSNGLDDALWCCRTAPEYNKEWRLFAVWCARQVQHLMTDPRSLAALDVAERHANGMAADGELNAAGGAAREAAREAAWGVAWEAARAARGVAWEAARAAQEAAREAAREAAWGVAREAAWGVAREAARAAREAARAGQTEQFLKIVGTPE